MARRTQVKDRSLAAIDGAVRLETMPGFIAPQLDSLKPKPPTGDRWIHEIKLDGYRSRAHVVGSKARIFTRKGLDWTKRFAAIADALAALRVDQAIIDGDFVVVVDERTDFGALQADLAAGRQDRLLFYAFDLLYLDGYDLRRVPLLERKRALKRLFENAGLAAPVLYSEHLEADGAAKRLNWEGIISKRADAPYRSGDRSDSWQKVKTSVRGEFPIVGFIPGVGGISALYLGKREGKDLRYVGKVGTGFSRVVSADLRKRLDAIATPKQKLTKPVRKPKARWVEPSLIADVEYRDVTDDGSLRHPSFKGLVKA
ncbi:ATP-dependent DNA ligase [Bradyrhizobium sp. Pear76]|nr:non-homologous end-joining DNA ligase [Bradyrhizobium oropedii]MCC8962478.1 ATP-dependent DNA ligase [Bradyrhizobium oropedii]